MKRIRKGKYLLLFPIIAGIISSCSDRPKDVLSEKELAEVISEMRIASAMFDTGQGRETGFSSREEAQIGVLRSHGLTQEDYRRSIQWYGENLDRLEKVNKSVTGNLEKKIAKYDPAAKDHQIAENDIWPYANHMLYTPGMVSDGVIFSILDPMIEKGGYAELKMKTSDPNCGMSVLVGVEYEDGSSSYTGRTASGFPQIKIRVQSDTARKVRRLYGYMRPTNKLVRPVTFDSISLVRMPLDSTEYYRISSQTEIDRPKKKEKPIPQEEVQTRSDDSRTSKE